MTELTAPQSSPEQSVDEADVILRYCREHYQRRLEEIIRLSGITSPQVVEDFSREVCTAYDELTSSTQQEGFSKTAGLTASTISLVGNDDLEINIRIQDIANRLKDDAQMNHWRVQQRYMTLLDRPNMTVDKNPVGLEPIARGLKTLCRSSGLNLDNNLDQLDRLEEQLQSRLPEVYLELNGLLEHHGVEPLQIQIIQRSGAGGPAAAQSKDAPAAIPSALASLQQALRQQFATSDSALAETSPEGMVPYLNASGSAGNAVLNASTLMMLNHLTERLNALETQQFTAFSSPTDDGTGDAQPLRVLRSKDIDLPLGQPASIALDTLSLIFDALFADPDLPDTVKAAIGRLQIPLLKQAILDPAFFTDTQHPARRLVNRMARAAIGLAQDTGREHPVCANLVKLADTLRANLEANVGDFSLHLEELDTLILERDKSIINLAHPYIQLVSEHEARGAALTASRTWLLATQDKTGHPEIRRFLSECWLRVMQHAHAKGGTAGPRWKDSAATIDELLWSVKTKQNAEERKQLLALIPSLLKRVNAELDHVGISSDERAPFLNVCFELQSSALRARPDAPTSTPPSPAIQHAPELEALTGPADAASIQILEQSGKLVQYFGQPTVPQTTWRNNNNRPCKAGDWISFELPDGEHLCGLHCWQGEFSATVLLFNSDWGFAVALSPAMLEQQLRDQRARILSDASLFDDAAARALGQMSVQGA
ncbi:MAG: DUF1631 family protein [Betaproteobacteria bacterium]